MKKYLFILFSVLLFLPSLAMSKKVDKMKYIAEWSTYEVTTISVGQNETKNLKVWGFGKNINKAIEQAKKNAIHACLFRGLPGAANARTTPAIFANQGKDQVALENFEYFYDFFEVNKEYIGFVNITTDGVPSGQDRREVKGGYKVAISVQVMYDNLKEKMSNDGILKKASSMFTY